VRFRILQKSLVAMGFAAMLAPMHAQAPARPEFEVAAIKLNTGGQPMVSIMAPPGGGRLTTVNTGLKMLITFAYKVKNYEILGSQGWMDSERYDVTAKAPDGAKGQDQLQLMTQTLLEDRFKLKVHRETKEVPVYVLVAGKNGPKLTESKEGVCTSNGPGNAPPPPPGPPGAGQLPRRPDMRCGGMFMGPNSLTGGRMKMEQFITGLSNILGRPVIDKTGFTGTFDVQLTFSPEGTAFAGGLPGLPAGLAPPVDNSLPSIFTAVQEQLGLKVESGKGPGQVLVIDYAEKPSEN